MQRLQEAEARSDELSQVFLFIPFTVQHIWCINSNLNNFDANSYFFSKALTTSTRPLLRQIESLQHSLTSQRLAEEKSEKVLEEKLSKLLFKFRNDTIIELICQFQGKLKLNYRLSAIKKPLAETCILSCSRKQSN